MWFTTLFLDQRNTSYNYGNAGKILPQAQGSVGGQSATEHMGQENSSRKGIKLFFFNSLT